MLSLCEQVVELRERQDTTDIFYFSESSNYNSVPEDSIGNSISEITNLFFPKLKIVAENKPASHAGIYKYWVKEINLKKNKPKAVVVTLNMRSFGAAWINSDQETYMQQCITLLKPYPNIINRFLLALNAFDDKTPVQREQMMLSDWKKTKLIFPFNFKYKTVREWDNGLASAIYLETTLPSEREKIILACHYVKAYAFNLNENNPRIKDFDEIATWCDKNNINLYLNLMAENIQYADSLVGKELVFLMRQNRDYLMKRYNKNNCVVVDNLDVVNGKNFTDKTWTTEHYDYKGRMVIAKNLADTLLHQFLNQYKKAY